MEDGPENRTAQAPSATPPFVAGLDGAVRELPRGLLPQAEYLLDWFHVILESAALSKVDAIEAGSGAELGLERFA